MARQEQKFLTSTMVWFNHLCFDGSRISSIDNLRQNLELWSRALDPLCRSLYRQFQSIYTLDFHIGKIKLPDHFKEKVFRWLGGNEESIKMVYDQPVTHVFNEYTMEQTIYSPIRSRRPLKDPAEDSYNYFMAESQSTGQDCDFCSYKINTAMDVFGRLESNFSFTASNAFKLDHWHGLIALKSHNLLNASQESVNDLMKLALNWFSAVREVDKSAVYPMLNWDHTAHAGASQFHPHIQAFLGSSHYFGNFEKHRRAAQLYWQDHNGRSYFRDIVDIHSALGLTVTYGTATAVVEVTERGDGEFVIYSAEPDDDLFSMLFFILRTYLDELEAFSFSCGMAFPIMSDDSEASRGSLPAVVRLTTRGVISEIFSEISGFDLYLSSNTLRDPYVLIDHLRKVINNHSMASKL